MQAQLDELAEPPPLLEDPLNLRVAEAVRVRGPRAVPVELAQRALKEKL